MAAPQLTTYYQGIAQVNADGLNTFVQWSVNVANLRNFVGLPSMTVYMQGYSTPGDGGQGNFYWNASGTGPDDNGVTNIVPPAAGTGCWTRLGGTVQTSGILAAGWNNFIITPTSSPDPTPTSFALSLPAGLAAFDGVQTIIPAVTSTLAASTIYDYQLNANGTFTVTSQPTSNYTALPRYPNLLHVWRVETNSAGIANIQLEANTYPTVQRPDDKALTIDSFAENYYIYNSTTNWSANLAVTYGELLVVITGAGTGNIYQVIIPGNTGSSAPTSTAPGSIPDGNTVILQYYAQWSYLGMFRYGTAANGIEWYFTNIALRRVCHRTLLTGSPIGAPVGTTLASMVKNYLVGGFLNVIANRVNSGTYKFGMKMITAGFIWINTTYGSGGAGGTVASSSPFTSGYSVGSTQVDGTITWKAIYASYASQTYFWMDTDRTFLTYTAPDSHDSYASTFISLLARYIQLTGDYNWLQTSSSQPSGSGTYFTYQQVLTSIFTDNLANLINLSPQFLTQVFQSNVNPLDGSSYTAFFLEDNCESYSGFIDAAYIFGILGDTTNQTNSVGYANDVNSGIFNLYDVNFNLFTYVYGTSVSSFYSSTTLQFYPWMQAQFFPELHNIPSITNDQRLSVRLWVSQRWESWWSDRGKDLLPDTEFGFLAAFMWQDAAKAYAFIENSDRYFSSGAVIHEVAYYLNAKESMIPDQRILNIETGVLTFEDMNQNIIKAYSSNKLKIKAQTSNFTLSAPANTYIQYIYVLETAGNAITGGLDIGTTNGGQQVVAAQTVGANSIQIIPPASVLKQAFSTSVATVLYFNAHSSWNSASIDVQVIYGSLNYGQSI